ncbi:WS/DGAT domain-containing protein [Frankia sp. Ag45/Mut15]|uniref:diacylglycerol O-acyltransferase n=1 Tax=Frankia umida TaxID=573489 RepID=A0ABT0K1N4_9ACTN|nr:wax ester/triacylglycerol synthase domain-containing protein [Frankia umida]MCK9877392.1 WS/DGAT domain-containing protein [Frankia umida]
MTQISTHVAGARSGTSRTLTTGDRAFLSFTLQYPGEFLEGGVVLCVEDPGLTERDLRAHVAARLAEAPALTERLVRPIASAPAPGDVVWQHDDALDLDYHVGVVDLPAYSAAGGLRAALDDLATRPLDLERPLWRLWLLRGHSPTEVAIVYRFSHIHQDGSAAHQALHLLFGDGHGAARRTLRTFDVPHARDYARMAASIARSLPRTRQLASWGGPPRGAARHTWALTELDRLRRIARRESVTVNDVYLAAVAGAVRTWSLPEWTPPTPTGADRSRGAGRIRHAMTRIPRQRAFYTAMPINVRTPDEQEVLSNFTLATRVPLPCTEADPRRRLALVAAQTRRAKADGRFGVVERRMLDRTPPGISPRTFALMVAAGARPADTALFTSNVGTMWGPYTVAGRPVSTLIGIAPMLVGRQHLSAALYGLDGQLCAAFTASASVPGHTELAGHWLAELAALEGSPRPGPPVATTTPPVPPRPPVIPTPRTAPPQHTARPDAGRRSSQVS